MGLQHPPRLARVVRGPSAAAGVHGDRDGGAEGEGPGGVFGGEWGYFMLKIKLVGFNCARLSNFAWWSWGRGRGEGEKGKRGEVFLGGWFADDDRVGGGIENDSTGWETA